MQRFYTSTVNSLDYQALIILLIDSFMNIANTMVPPSEINFCVCLCLPTLAFANICVHSVWAQKWLPVRSWLSSAWSKLRNLSFSEKKPEDWISLHRMATKYHGWKMKESLDFLLKHLFEMKDSLMLPAEVLMLAYSTHRKDQYDQQYKGI